MEHVSITEVKTEELLAVPKSEFKHGEIHNVACSEEVCWMSDSILLEDSTFTNIKGMAPSSKGFQDNFFSEKKYFLGW